MSELVALAVIVLAGFALFGIVWWLERATRRPGLSFLICGIVLLVGAGLGLRWWQRLLFGLQAIGFLYLARWRQVSARAAAPDA